MNGHLAAELLLDVALGEVAAAREALPHLRQCAACRARLSEARAFVEATREELVESRPGCLTSDEIASLPAGAEADHPHLKECSLCREEHAAWLAFEARRDLGLDERPMFRPDLVTRGGTALYAAGGEAIELELAEGAETAGAIAGVRVSLRVESGELVVTVDGAPKAPLRLKLETAVLERRMDLAPGETRLPAGRWKKATVLEGAS